ncbi:hypothetical protein BpHYR1_044276, partial [Brachionus plicatilis]
FQDSAETDLAYRGVPRPGLTSELYKANQANCTRRTKRIVPVEPSELY